MIMNNKSNLLTMAPRISIEKKHSLTLARIDQLEIENALLHGMLQKQIDINQSKITFLTKVSHELRSPLTSVQLSASLIEHYYQRMDKEKVFGHLSKIKDAVSDFVVILNNYLLTEQGQKADEDQFTG
jgi:signal transduction histidine kinase